MSTATEEVKVDVTSMIGEMEEEVEVRPYTLRKFKDGDLFPLLNILKKIGIKDCKEAFIQVDTGDKTVKQDCKEAFIQVATEDKTVKQVGILTAFDMADIFIGNLPKAEAEIYALYADMAGITVEQIKEMEFGTLPLMIYDSFHGVKNTSFFKVLSRLL